MNQPNERQKASVSAAELAQAIFSVDVEELSKADLKTLQRASMGLNGKIHVRLKAIERSERLFY